MTQPAEKPSSHIQVIPAALEQEPILANLLELYAHDFTDFYDLELGADGRFGYTGLSLYWSEPHRHPFLIWVNGKLTGFVLVKKGSEFSGDPAVWDMAEFFVIRRYRRHGIGTQVAHEVWKRFPGPWEVRVMQANVPANHFWARAISTFAGSAVPSGPIEKDGKSWDLFAFQSRHVTP
jgi:predicted acetyltransferase